MCFVLPLLYSLPLSGHAATYRFRKNDAPVYAVAPTTENSTHRPKGRKSKPAPSFRTARLVIGFSVASIHRNHPVLPACSD
jgi:hypothetical protein